jgi:hypothetical protein
LACFTMSSRFSAHDYDDRPLSSPRSLVDLSPSSHARARSASGSLGSEDPKIRIPSHTHDDGERSSIIRINTDFTVRIFKNNPHVSKNIFRFPSQQLLIDLDTPLLL